MSALDTPVVSVATPGNSVANPSHLTSKYEMSICFVFSHYFYLDVFPLRICMLVREHGIGIFINSNETFVLSIDDFNAHQSKRDSCLVLYCWY